MKMLQPVRRRRDWHRQPSRRPDDFAGCSRDPRRPRRPLTTSNKPDPVETTRKMRDQVGTTWAFHPPRLVDEVPTWWRSPLSKVTDDTTAVRLAGHSIGGSREAGDKRCVVDSQVGAKPGKARLVGRYRAA